MGSSKLKRVMLATMVAVFSFAAVIGSTTSIAMAQNTSHVQTNLVAQATEPVDPAAPSDPTLDPEIQAAPATADVVEAPATCEGSFVGLGWLMCQITRAVYGFFDWLVHSVLEERLLKIDLIEDEPALKQAWGGFKTVANLFFVIAFLVIIYAEATGRFGVLETYSVQRLLPRLAFAAIGIQLSYFIVGYLIILFNDLGAGATQLVLAPVEGFNQFQLNGLFTDMFNETSFSGIPLEGGGDFVDNLVAAPAILALGIAAIIFLPTLLLFGSLGLLLLLLTLIARKIIVIALVVVAPIAFAMYVLPATEKLFKQWWDTFLKTLAMYPIIMIFIAAGQLLGRLAIAGDNVTFIDSTIGFVATFLPLFLIPATFRLAGSAIATLAGSLKNANEKMKGDTRDPRSVRSVMRNQRGRDWNRMMSGNKPGIPSVARRGLKRMPFIDSNAPLMADMAEGKQWFENFQELGADEMYRAITLTGGGRWRGATVKHSEGSSYTGWLKHGKKFDRDANGEIKYDQSGAAMLIDKDGNTKAAKEDDFYSPELMAEVKSMRMSRGRLVYSAMYTMSKSPSEYEQAQVWHGIRSSQWKPSELQDYVNTVWYGNKGEYLHHKFHDQDYLEDKPGRHQDMAIEEMNTRPGKLPANFKKMAEYVDEKLTGYALTQQSGAFWRFASNGIGALEPGELSQRQLNHMRGLYDKARQATVERLATQEYNDEGEPIGMSQSTAEAIREMKTFINVYNDQFGNGNGNQ